MQKKILMFLLCVIKCLLGLQVYVRAKENVDWFAGGRCACVAVVSSWGKEEAERASPVVAAGQVDGWSVQCLLVTLVSPGVCVCVCVCWCNNTILLIDYIFIVCRFVHCYARTE